MSAEKLLSYYAYKLRRQYPNMSHEEVYRKAKYLTRRELQEIATLNDPQRIFSQMGRA